MGNVFALAESPTSSPKSGNHSERSGAMILQQSLQFTFILQNSMPRPTR